MKFENTQVWGFDHAIRGMRNAKNSWNKADSGYKALASCLDKKYCENCTYDTCGGSCGEVYIIGPNDMKLIQSLIKGGPEHRKFMRQIFVSVDITAPLYWWKEFDTYKVSTVSNSCSTMHTITKYKFNTNMFECKDLSKDGNAFLLAIIDKLNSLRKEYLETADKNIWKEIIILLPESFIQKRTITMNYENLLGMCSKSQRRFHKLTEWSTDFINWARSLPYAQEFIFTDEINK